MTLEATQEAAVRLLRAGGVVVFPTDTLYGVGALATNDAAVARVFRIKERPLDRPLPLLIADPLDMAPLAQDVPEVAWKLARHFWPGGLTLVLGRSPRFHSLALAGGDTIAVRVPNHELARALIQGAGGPLTGTSANRSGGPPPRTAEEARGQIGDAVDLIIDAGPCPGGVESTVVDLTGPQPRIVRRGAVCKRRLEEAIGQAVAG